MQRLTETISPPALPGVTNRWEQEEWIKLPRASRPIANTLKNMPWIPGTNSINLPKISGGTAVAVQTDGGSVQSTDITTTSVNGAVQTIAGQQDRYCPLPR